MMTKSYNLRMGAREPEYIDPDNSWEMNYWSTKLHCTKAELAIAARSVGPRMEEVKKFIALIKKKSE